MTHLLIARFLCAFVSLGLIANLGLGQLPPVQTGDAQWYFRYELFQYILEQRGLTPLQSMDEAIQNPESSVVVLLGNLNQVKVETWRELEKMVAKGGCVLIATDLGCSLQGFGQVRTGPVLSRQPKQQYMGYTDCLVVQNLTADQMLTRDLRQIITNRGGWLIKPNDNVRGASTMKWEVIATYPEIRANAGSLKPLMAICKSIQPNDGVAIISADASPFSNAMLWHGDNGQLAKNTADVLCSPTKKHVFFCIDGGMVPPRLEVPRPELPPDTLGNPPAEQDMASTLRFANHAIKKVADSGLMNEALKNQPRKVDVPTYFHWVWGSIAALITFFALVCIAGGRTWIPPFLDFRRMKSLHQMQRVHDHPLNRNSQAVSLLARDFCRRWTGSDSLEVWQKHLGTIPRENFQLRSIFEIAISGHPSMVSDDQMQAIGATMRELLHRLPPK